MTRTRHLRRAVRTCAVANCESCRLPAKLLAGQAFRGRRPEARRSQLQPCEEAPQPPPARNWGCVGACPGGYRGRQRGRRHGPEGRTAGRPKFAQNGVANRRVTKLGATSEVPSRPGRAPGKGGGPCHPAPPRQAVSFSPAFRQTPTAVPGRFLRLPLSTSGSNCPTRLIDPQSNLSRPGAARGARGCSPNKVSKTERPCPHRLGTRRMEGGSPGSAAEFGGRLVRNSLELGEAKAQPSTQVGGGVSTTKPRRCTSFSPILSAWPPGMYARRPGNARLGTSPASCAHNPWRRDNPRGQRHPSCGNMGRRSPSNRQNPMASPQPVGLALSLGTRGPRSKRAPHRDKGGSTRATAEHRPWEATFHVRRLTAGARYTA